MIREEFSIKSQIGDILTWSECGGVCVGVVRYDGKLLYTWREGKKDLVTIKACPYIDKDSFVRLADRIEKDYLLTALFDYFETADKDMKLYIRNSISEMVYADLLDTVTVSFCPRDE